MKYPHLRRTMLAGLIALTLFTYLVLAASYGPVLFTSFKRFQPSLLAHRSREAELASSQYKNRRLQREEEEEARRPPPKAVVLWTTWRSGSTFLGQLLANAVDDTFYSTEPLHYWKVNFLHANDTKTAAAKSFLQELLNCNVSRKFQKQIEYMSRQGFYMKWNTYFSRKCRPMRACAKRKFVNYMCRRANIHVIKVLRLALKWAWTLLTDENLDLKIIFVTRDPRAVLLSRARVEWCFSETCRKPKVVCDLLENDLKQAQTLAETFPHKFQYMQYERISKDPETALRNLMAFIQLPVSESQQRLLNPASTNPDSLYSTKKNPRTQSERWRETAAFNTVNHIQNECSKPLAMLGLPMFQNEKELKNMAKPLISDNASIVNYVDQ